jgi:hypothetical protein
MATMSAPCGCHISAMWPPRHLLRCCHVICHVAATSSNATSFATSSSTSVANSSLWVMWQVNPWRSHSSQILGVGLVSMGFTPIYNDLEMSWITLIYDENVSSSRHLICWWGHDTHAYDHDWCIEWSRRSPTRVSKSTRRFKFESSSESRSSAQ